ncbi:UDP-N-acetyl-D-mannosamine dehydrogenase [Neptunomonas japonica]|uniref:UDP-N-acetyl-D-mannosamine dehydrogenase n=1 Tax=Neptunomonas japonica TaxID=417574 RepID=UPI0004257888|nr:UDP-N-acetyl-D-mannosamine dehydrogenase [Neptunomonas japonica]
MEFNLITVMGLGYIGLPTAAMFASRKKEVIGVDINEHAVNTINSGKIHIVEPELDMVVHAAVTEGYLKATTKPSESDAFLIAVPTPFKGDHEPDLSYIKAASKAIAPALKKDCLVILESTSPVGTTEKMAAWLAEARPDLTFPLGGDENSDVLIAYCPERVLPGHVMRELIENDRIIGGLSKKSSTAAVDLYKTFVDGECIVTNARTAEMCKLTENSFRDVNIAFANELSMICDKQDVNVWELIALANRHPRVDILQPGCGVGGHCIAVDPWFIVSSSPEDANIIRMAREINDKKPKWVVEKANEIVKNKLIENPALKTEDIVIACLGLAFKPDIDDLRESPALMITKEIIEKHAGKVIIVEPNITKLPQDLEGKCELYELVPALAESDIVVLLVDHKGFKNLDKSMYSDVKVLDTRGIW